MRVFRKHALRRVDQRTSLTPEEIDRLLDEGRYVPLANSDAEIRSFYLIYSCFDKAHFVVVEDPRDKEVLTVLPIQYLNRTRVSLSALEESRRLAVTDKIVSKHSPSKFLGKRFHIRVRVRDTRQDTQKTVQLKALNIDRLGHESLESLLEDSRSDKIIIRVLLKHIAYRKFHVAEDVQVCFAEVPDESKFQSFPSLCDRFNAHLGGD